MILKKKIKKVIYLFLNLFMLIFQVIIIKLLKFELFKIMQSLHEIGEDLLMGKENKPNNAFENDDFHEPDNTISIKIVKIINNIKGEDRNLKKIYFI